MILGYRIVTFLLAGGYFVEMFTRQGLHMFHYLTIWGLTASLVCAGMMLYHTLVVETRRFNFFLCDDILFKYCHYGFILETLL